MDTNKSVGTEPASHSSRFESDTQRIVRLHLQDKNHVITEEDIRNVRVGMMPVQSNEAQIQELQQTVSSDGHSPSKEPLTSYDALER